jgi:hypothetical protein
VRWLKGGKHVCKYSAKRIYLQPFHLKSVTKACEQLTPAAPIFRYFSPCPGGVVNDLGVILIEARDITKDLAVLGDAGMRAVVD